MQRNVLAHVRPRGRGGRRRRRAAARQDRHDHARQPPGGRVPAAPGVGERELADAAQLASLADETPEGRSIVVLAKQNTVSASATSSHDAHFIPFSAQTRMSGVDLDGRQLRKGAADAIASIRRETRRLVPPELARRSRAHRARGRHAARRRRNEPACSGVIHLKDIVKGGMQERFAQLRAMGIKHRDDHRRQPADRRGDRRRSGRRRLPGRGDARSEARADPRAPVATDAWSR